jgi:threonine/homoserine/homoserine lactone efflux protein
LAAGPARSHREPPAARRGGAARQGLATDLLDPKVGVFYVALLPQFLP